MITTKKVKTMKKLLIPVILLCIIIPFTGLHAAEKNKAISSYSGMYFYTKPYNPIAMLDYQPVDGLLYPKAFIELTTTITVPQKTEVSEQINKFLDALIKNYKMPEINPDLWIQDVLNQYFSSFEKQSLKKVADVFKKTQTLTEKDIKLREAAVKTLNQDFLKLMKGMEQNKGITAAIKKMKTAIVNELKKSQKVTISGLDVHFNLSINSLKAPTIHTGLLSKLSNSNKSRDLFYSKLPTFSFFNPNSSSKYPKVNNIVYFDFPCEYIKFPSTPDFKVMVELPADLGSEGLFFVHHALLLRELKNPHRTMTTSHADGIFSSFMKFSDEYAKLLFSDDGISLEEYEELNKNFRSEVVSQKTILGKLIEKTINNAIEEQNPGGTNKISKVSYVVDGPTGYDYPDAFTYIELADPEKIDLETEVSVEEFKNKIQALNDEVLIVFKAFEEHCKQSMNFVTEFKEYIDKQERVKNSDFKSFLQKDKTADHIRLISMLELKMATRFINDLGRLQNLMAQAKALWTMSDIVGYTKEESKLNSAIQPLKNLLLKLMTLQYYWQSARVYSYDTNLDLKERLIDVVSANNADETQGFDFLQKWVHSLYSSFKEIEKHPKDFATDFSSSAGKIIEDLKQIKD